MKYQEKLLALSQDNSDILVMTAENRAPLREIIPDLGERFIDTGITEQTLVGMAAGLALRGRIPVVHGLASFLTMRAFEFIRTDIGIPHLPVKLVGFIPGLLSEANGPTHQALEDIGLMLQIPGMRVFSPATHEELVSELENIIFDPHPWYIRYTQREHGEAFPFIGKEKIRSWGQANKVMLLTHGTLFTEAYQTQKLLELLGLEVALLHVPYLSPLPEKALLNSIEGSEHLVVIEDHFKRGGLTSLISECLISHRSQAKLHSFCFEAKWFRTGLLPEVLETEGFTPEKLAHRIQEALALHKNLKGTTV
ncbi:MAG: transketolase [Proteobacteria bacterium]|nr:transketolase [Pseudomonadota bacterium]NDD05263.1 transketolase [Pseudomonadota bacterium]NDG26666.1 transketolase [Pseudomonadota bacterium]